MFAKNLRTWHHVFELTWVLMILSMVANGHRVTSIRPQEMLPSVPSGGTASNEALFFDVSLDIYMYE